MISQDILRRKKKAILFLGMGLFFFTSMSKILIPGTIFNQLQMDLALSVAEAAFIGAVYMYSYAFSQFMMGIFSDRYGGVRLLLIGGSLFSAGMLGVPFVHHAWSMSLFRCITALGAGTVFLGLAKLVSDLFAQNFTLMLGLILLSGYLGPAAGVYPVSKLVRIIGWRWTMLIPAVMAAVLTLLIISLSRGTVRRTLPGNAFKSLGKIFVKRDNGLLFFSSSIFFGLYYTLLLFAGQKVLEDIGGLKTSAAALWMTFFCFLIALGNVAVNWILKLLKGNGAAFLRLFTVFAVCGSVTGWCAFHYHLPVGVILFSFLLLTLPAAVFSGYSTIARDLNPDQVGLAVSMLNFWAFIGIALVNHAAGMIMNRFEAEAVRTEQALIYPSAAYESVFLFFVILSAITLISSFCLRNPEKI